MTATADIGLIGLAVMGQNLALNMADHGYSVVVYNRTSERTAEFMAGPAEGMSIAAAGSPLELAAALRAPRRILLMVKAGPAVDAVVADLAPHLDPGDIVIDGGNSHYKDDADHAKTLGRRKPWP